MAKIKEIKEEKKNISSNDILTNILKEHKDEHYNFQERVDWKISTGSLLLDIATGGISPMLLRICGSNNEGKTPEALEICRNFLINIKNSKGLWVIAEGRGLSKENIERCGLTFVYKPEEWVVGTIFVLETNVFELFIKTVKTLVLDNPDNYKYAFIVDSLDGLQLRDDRVKDITENNRVCGVPALSKKMLQSLSLGMFKYGHLMILLSQVTSEIKIDPYAKTANRGGNFSGGNSLLHGSDLIWEHQTSFPSDYILDNPNGKLNDGKSKPVGKYCKVIIQKSQLEATRKQMIQYPIKFGRKPSGIWLEHELAEMLMAWDFVKKSASWLAFSEVALKEFKEIDPELPEKIQGIDNLRRYLEEKPKLVEYLFNKFKSVLSN